MLGSLPTPILLDLAILCTALCWAFGFYIAEKRVYIFAPLAIGCFVCLLGYSIESLGAPAWMVVAGPIPLDLLLLWYVLRSPRRMLLAYFATWALYVPLDVALSATLRYDSLIPAWRLHS
jgi:hypothetical protein